MFRFPELSPLQAAVSVVISAALLLSTAAIVAFPPRFTDLSWLIAFATLLALALFSGALALRRTEGGTTTSLDFIPQLGALLLVGPSGAALVTLASQSVSQVLFQQKRTIKAVFNIAQLTAATALAGIVFSALGGTPSLSASPPLSTVPPYIAATAVYFGLNTTAVSYIISKAEKTPFADILSRLSGGLGVLAADMFMSLLGIGIAYLYTVWGALALLLAALPIIGLRYSYGVNLELRQLNQDLLRVLVKALEARDPYTSGHSVRVAERSRAIAEELGLRRSRVRNIETAALLHDIGKIDQAYHEILRHEGRLDERQRKLIRQHPERGVQLVQSVRSLDPVVLDYIKHHHERFDGDGYPDGLAGKEIPIGARIIMVADTIDAMLTARPYRDALSVPVVREELREYSGEQFDPDIVEVALTADIIKTDEVTTDDKINVSTI